MTNAPETKLAEAQVPKSGSLEDLAVNDPDDLAGEYWDDFNDGVELTQNNLPELPRTSLPSISEEEPAVHNRKYNPDTTFFARLLGFPLTIDFEKLVASKRLVEQVFKTSVGNISSKKESCFPKSFTHRFLGIPTINARAFKSVPLFFADPDLSFRRCLFLDCEWQSLLLLTTIFALTDCLTGSSAVAAIVALLVDLLLHWSWRKIALLTFSKNVLITAALLE
jgi:hypothetical protein